MIDQTHGGWIPPHEPSALLALDDPALHRAQRAPAQRPDRPALVRVQRAVERDERRPQRIVRRPRLRRAARAQLVDRERDRRRRPQRRDDRQRDDRLPGPAAEGVDRERRAAAAAGSARAASPARRSHDQSAEQRQPHPREDAASARRRPRRGRARGARRMCAASAGSPASRSATYASTVVERSAGPPKNVAHVPSSRCFERIQRRRSRVGSSVEDARGSWRRKRSSASIVTLVSSSPFHQPSACWSASRCSTRAVERVARGAVHGAAVGDGHAAASSGSRGRAPSAAARARARPLRTAPSIVAGQPVSVHAPAR